MWRAYCKIVFNAVVTFWFDKVKSFKDLGATMKLSATLLITYLIAAFALIMVVGFVEILINKRSKTLKQFADIIDELLLEV